MKRNHLLLPIMLLAGAQPALAAFVLVDDFESYADGANGTTANWNQGFPTGGVGAGTTSAIVSSALTDGQGLAFTYGATTGGQINYSTGATIAAEGGTGTLFFQAGWTATGSDTLFATGRSGAAAYGDLATLFRVPTDLIIEVHNGGYANTGTTAANNTVYNFWVVIDNSANNWDLYSSTGTNAPSLIQADIAFRNATAGDINTFYIGTNDGSAPTIDNIYIDSTGANLVNPIPEPGSLALLGFAALGAVARRRRA